MRAKIYMKNGAVIECDIDEITVQRNQLEGLVGLKWITPADWTSKLQYIDLSEIIAILTTNEVIT